VIAALSVIGSPAVPAAAQPDPKINFAIGLRHWLRHGDQVGVVRTTWLLDRPERCPVPLHQIVWRFSGPRDTSTIKGVSVEEFDSSRPRRIEEKLKPSERHQYQVIAYCPPWSFEGSPLAGPAFTMNIREDEGSGVTYRGGPWSTITGQGFSGGTTHVATRVGGNARINFDGLAVAWVTTRDFKASSDTDQDQVLVRCGIGPAHDCDRYGTAQMVTSAPRMQRMMAVREFRQWDAGSRSVSSRVRIIAENADGVDVDAFIIVVRCEPRC
jgi:hypothetical protein